MFLHPDVWKIVKLIVIDINFIPSYMNYLFRFFISSEREECVDLPGEEIIFLFWLLKKLWWVEYSAKHEIAQFELGGTLIGPCHNWSKRVSIILFRNYGSLYCITPDSYLHKLTYFWRSSKLWNWFNNKLFLINSNNQILCFLHTYAKQLSQPKPNTCRQFGGTRILVPLCIVYTKSQCIC